MMVPRVVPATMTTVLSTTRVEVPTPWCPEILQPSYRMFCSIYHQSRGPHIIVPSAAPATMPIAMSVPS